LQEMERCAIIEGRRMRLRRGLVQGRDALIDNHS
jgi:hypothetical protein